MATESKKIICNLIAELMKLKGAETHEAGLEAYSFISEEDLDIEEILEIVKGRVISSGIDKQSPPTSLGFYFSEAVMFCYFKKGMIDGEA